MCQEFDLKWHHAVTRVVIGDGALGGLGDYCRAVGRFERAIVVTDENVAGQFGNRAAETLRSVGCAAEVAIIPAGDASKSLRRVELLYDRLASFGVSRDGAVVAVGGGVVTDLAGFVAATWMRGVAAVLCPTTLEADIDAAIGGKTGVNHSSGKNLIGVFRHPPLVVVDTDCLKTLSDRDMAAGMAESVKHGVITGEAFTAWHERNASAVLGRDEATLGELIARNIDIKASVVARDEREESGARAVLNFGHTIGHAIEKVSAYRLRHGECVSLGMVAACRLSQAMGLLANDVADRVERLLRVYGLLTRLDQPVDVEAICDHVGRDKKTMAGKTRFVLLKALGETVLESDVPQDAIRSAIASIQPGPCGSP